LLSPFLSTETAARCVAALIAPLTAGGLFALSRAAHGRIAPSAFIALPLIFNQAWMWGFQNFGLGTALALFVAAWMLQRPEREWYRQAWLAALALMVWTAHLGSWGILLVMAAGQELAGLRQPADLGGSIRRNWPLLVPVVPLVFWRAGAQAHSSVFAYGNFLANKAIVFASIFKGTSKPFDVGLLIAVVIAALIAGWAAKKGKVEPRLALGGVLLTIATLAAPITIFNAWGTDLRCAPVALMLVVLSIRSPADARREGVLIMLGLALFTARLGVVTWDWLRQSAQYEARLTLLDNVARGSRLGYIYVWPQCGFPWRLNPETKLGSYAVTRRDAFAGSLFQVMNADIVKVRDPRLDQHWHDGTQNLMPLCPQDAVDQIKLHQVLASMRSDGLNYVWISGLSPEVLGITPGYRLLRHVGNDDLLIAI
jgi:hypothetical protein